MNILIKIHGHQLYREVSGRVLSWGQTVEHYGEQPMQVPCVTLQHDGKIEVVSLKGPSHWTDIVVHDPNPLYVDPRLFNAKPGEIIPY